MPKIIVANNDNPDVFADHRVFTPDFNASIDRVAARMLWFAEAGDILVINRRPAESLLRHVAMMQGRPLHSLTMVCLDECGFDLRSLGEDALMSETVLANVRRAMAGRGPWTVQFYWNGREVGAFTRRLGLQDDAARSFLAEAGVDIINDKRLFRTLAAARGIPLAEGAAVTGRAALGRALPALIGVTGSVIVKLDRHQGGLGNVIVTRGPDGPRLGAAHRFVCSGNSLEAAADFAWSHLGHDPKAVLVVEAYHEAAAILTSEFMCRPSLQSVEFLNWGQLRQAPIFSGLVMPPSVPAMTGGKFVAGATEIARLAVDLGFHGLINIDGIVTAGGQVIYNEWNGRVGACSHMHLIAERLAGRNYGGLVMASRKVEPAGDIDAALDLIDNLGIGYRPATREGMVVSYGGASGDRELEIVTLAADLPRLTWLEDRFDKGWARDAGDRLTDGKIPFAREASQI